jgi:hypothetical protein
MKKAVWVGIWAMLPPLVAYSDQLINKDLLFSFLGQVMLMRRITFFKAGLPHTIWIFHLEKIQRAPSD